ncbi:MAG TPA: SPW repeat protein, partial [bacterium]|nr:SPW repeat protein [bacterium]
IVEHIEPCEQDSLGGARRMTAYWVTLLAGVWVALSPFFLFGSSLKWSNVVFGIVIAALTYYRSTSKPK